jgi:hypothetical protein
MTTSRGTRRRGVLLGLALGASVLAVPAATASMDLPGAEPVLAADSVSLVRVSTPTRADKDRLTALPLDLTEHAGPDFVEVVLHGATDVDLLQSAGFDYDVEVADLVAQDRERRELDAAYAASTVRSPLPSGRDGYRTLAEYDAEMAQLAKDNPTLVKELVLPNRTIEGREVRGIEITKNVSASDGKPVFLLMGLHHAREWPSGEHTLEFAYDVVNGVKSGRPTINRLMDSTRLIVVPVVNPDGYHQSYVGGQAVDLREVGAQIGGSDGEAVTILGTPGNAYKRKNCRPADGVTSIPQGACTALYSQGGLGVGVDLNRNYGGLWGGPGAEATPEGATYRGEGPFSEPETRNIQALVSSRQVTTLISNHTFSNLVLRPPGVRAQGQPPDEPILAALGATMASRNGYTNQPSYALYDTTGTTEDWSYGATGGLGYTFEIGEEFHPPYERVVAHYVGGASFPEGERPAGWTGGGNRAAYFDALKATANPNLHSVVAGSAPPGARLTLLKTFHTVTSPVVGPTGETGSRQAFVDRLESALTVPGNGRFTWHVNPSTRPDVMARRLEVLGEAAREQAWTAQITPPPLSSADHEFVIAAGEPASVMQVDLTWPTPDDMDLEVYRKAADGTLTEVASSGNFLNDKERAVLDAPGPGTYVLRVVNYASASPTYDLTATLYGAPTYEATPALVEQYTLICSIGGKEVSRQLVQVDRGQGVKVAPCRRR